MSNGKLISGKYEKNPPKGMSEAELRVNILKSFFGFSIPALWHISRAYAFVINSGYECGENKPLDEYLDNDTMDSTGVCYEGKRYYLACPDGDATVCTCEIINNHGHWKRRCRNNKFSAPPGLDSLDGKVFGGITKEDLIKGSIRTYLQNDRKNGGKSADLTNDGTINSLLNIDMTTPGFIRIPVCSPERAYQYWDTTKAGSSENYPCDIPPGKSDCGDSTFEDQTSDASPSVGDYRRIISNIEGDGGSEWTTQVIGQNQREITKAGSCRFGVEATKTNGNVNFKVGEQDVIDIINVTIEKFGGSGKVGANGDMSCNGNIKGQNVKWGLY